MKRLNRAISKFLVAAFLVTNIAVSYPSVSFAETQGTAEAKVAIEEPEKKTIKVFDVNRDKSEIIVKYKNNSKSFSKSSNKSEFGTNLKSKLKLSKFEVKREFKNNRIDLLGIGEKDDINKVINELKKNPDVEYAQPNYKLEIASLPADAMFTKQWALSNSGQDVEGQVGRSGVDINAVNAWNLTKGAQNVTIGILDTGIDINHEDLKNSIYVNTSEANGTPGVDDDGNGYVDDINGWDFVNNDKTIYDDSTLDFHGTHVSGIIAASSNNLGISGVAPNVKILPLKFINGNWGYTCDAIDAIEYAMAKGVKVINCSFGGTDNNFALKDTMANSGILFICAAGNRSADVAISPVYPACFDLPNILSVASIDSMGVLSPYSSYGSKIHVAAPGVNVLSTTPGNTYDYLSGTSAAVPYVTGIAALLKSQLPNLSVTGIAQRIKDNVVPCTKLQGKVSSGGRTDAFAALTNTKPQTDTYNGPGNDNNTVPGGQQGGNEDTWYTLDQLAKIKEKLHYGESGVNPASGNFSFTVNDMSVPAPGFQINISRSYNSRNDKNTSLGRGWTFGFEGRLEGTDVIDAVLPNGSVERFRLTNGVYEPEESRSTFVKNADNTFTLTTKDQYKYTFNTGKYLVKMEDRNGNAVNIQVDASGKVKKVTDAVGREFIVNYNASNLIDNITDPESRVVRYAYNTNNQLTTVTGPKGGVMRYSYDTWGYLNEIKDHNQKLIENITYNHNEGENQHKVSQAIDSLACTVNYVYDMTNKKTTITDMNNRVSTYWFDSSFYTIQIQDPEGKSTFTEFHMYGGKNKYGDVKSTTDRNGNKTHYEVDARGNVTNITYTDNNTKVFGYDDKNNLIRETDECGKYTFYIYDTNKANLEKKVQPLNGTDEYVGVDSPNFAITVYQYYTGSESGCIAKGLLKSVTDPEGNTTAYTYDADGNIKTTDDPERKITTNHYNRIGWKDYSLTPKGYRSDYTYDKNGQLIKSVLSGGGETSRTIYDLTGRKTQEISPKQYDAGKDNIANDTYNDPSAGYRYEYYDSGKISKVTDSMGNITTYTYDVYGNVLTEAKPNSSIYKYEYDILDRIKKVYFKDNAQAAEELLKEYNYAIMGDCKTQKTETVYLNISDKAVTVYIYDYANRLVEQWNPDGTKVKTKYNANGTVDNVVNVNGSTVYNKYDGLNRLTETWTPFEVSNGNALYTYTKADYYKNGNKKCIKSGKDKVELFALPTSYAVTNYTYYKNGKVNTVTDAEGRKTEYFYDNDGNVKKEDLYIDATNKISTEYVYNGLQKLSNKKQHVVSGDIYGNAAASNLDKILITSYTYDKNGNIKTGATSDGVITTYTFDYLNRQTSISQPGVDETGSAAVIATSTVYNWANKPLTTTDANGRVTTYEYNPKGQLVRVIDAKNGVTAYAYDLGGRKIAEVSPKNYDGTKSIFEMNRVEYSYDLMNRLVSKRDVYLDPLTNQGVTVNSKSYKYDNSGNKIKELDAIGYDYGTGSTESEKIDSGYGTEYAYNFANQLVSITDPVSRERALPYTAKYSYDGLGRKTSETNAKGVVSAYSYDDAGNVLSVSVKENVNSAARIIKSATYDLAGRALTQTDANGNTITYEYNAFNKAKKIMYPGDSTIPANTITCQYDIFGNLKKQADSTGKVDLYTYDNQGRQLSYTRQKSDGTNIIATSVKYDKNGNKRFEINGNNKTTESSYDELNRLKTTAITVSGVKKTTSYDYDANGNQTTVTDWRGNTYTNVYDPLNRLTSKLDPYTTIQRLEYNRNNIQVKSYDALDNMTQYLYDRNNRLIATIDPELHTTSQTYDDVGNVQAKTDGRNITTAYAYDEYNRLKSVTNAKSEVTSYTYDLIGNKLTQTDGKDNTTSFEYNVAGKLIRKIDHGGRIGLAGNYTYIDAKTEKYSYYADGNLKTKIDRNGKTTSYEYDVHGRMISQTVNSISISYTYDSNGNQLTMTDRTGTTTRTYDEQNRVLTKAVPGFGTTTFAYDIIESGGGYSETTLDPKNNSTKKVYDKVGRLLYVINGSSTVTYSYYPDGSKKSVLYPDLSKEEYTYYKDGLNKTLINSKADGTLIDSYSYIYDAAHNQTSKTDSKGVTSYEYDSLNRLKKVTEPNSKVTGYTYDKAGNRETESVTAGTAGVITTYEYNEQNRLVKTVAQSGGDSTIEKYEYDNNGNTVSKTKDVIKPVDSAVSGNFAFHKAGQSTTTDITFYDYDLWNQLIKTVAGDKTTICQYNGEGLRVAKAVNGQATKYLYEADKVILETDAAGNQTARNIYGTTLLARTADSQTAYYMYNGHADVTALLGTTGDILASYYYDAFGNITEQTGSFNNPIRYAGYQYDGDTGLYYLNSRYYDSKISRFLTEDTYLGSANDPLSLNLYTYCYNNPITYIDSTGHTPTDWEIDFYNGVQGNASDYTADGMRIVNPTTTSESTDWGNDVVQWNNANGTVTYSINGIVIDKPRNAHVDRYVVDEGAIVDTINIDTGSTGHIYNSGIIGAVSTGNSNTYIDNSGFIHTITSGESSTTNIVNTGYINVFNTGAKSSNKVTNCSDSYIGLINTGLNNTTTIENFGAKILTSGDGKIIENLPKSILAKNYSEYVAKEAAEKAAKAKLASTILGRVAGFFMIFGELLLMEGSSDQRPADQRDENKRTFAEQIKKLKSDPKLKLNYDDQGRIIIYRWGNFNLNTCNPSPGKDAPGNDQSLVDFFKAHDTIGMSWSLVSPAPGQKYIKTTLEQVNETGPLIAIPDGGVHVSIFPATDGPWNGYSQLIQWAAANVFVNQDMETYDPDKAHTLTKLIRSISTKPDGTPIANK